MGMRQIMLVVLLLVGSSVQAVETVRLGELLGLTPTEFADLNKRRRAYKQYVQAHAHPDKFSTLTGREAEYFSDFSKKVNGFQSEPLDRSETKLSNAHYNYPFQLPTVVLNAIKAKKKSAQEMSAIDQEALRGEITAAIRGMRLVPIEDGDDSRQAFLLWVERILGKGKRDYLFRYDQEGIVLLGEQWLRKVRELVRAGTSSEALPADVPGDNASGETGAGAQQPRMRDQERKFRDEVLGAIKNMNVMPAQEGLEPHEAFLRWVERTLGTAKKSALVGSYQNQIESLKKHWLHRQEQLTQAPPQPVLERPESWPFPMVSIGFMKLLGLTVEQFNDPLVVRDACKNFMQNYGNRTASERLLKEVFEVTLLTREQAHTLNYIQQEFARCMEQRLCRYDYSFVIPGFMYERIKADRGQPAPDRIILPRRLTRSIEERIAALLRVAPGTFQDWALNTLSREEAQYLNEHLPTVKRRLERLWIAKKNQLSAQNIPTEADRATLIESLGNIEAGLFLPDQLRRDIHPGLHSEWDFLVEQLRQRFTAQATEHVGNIEGGLPLSCIEPEINVHCYLRQIMIEALNRARIPHNFSP